MKAVVLHEFGGPRKLLFEDVPDPVAGEGEVLVRVTATSVNPVDYKLRSGALQQYMPLELPDILGRDIVGIVRSLGPGVSGFTEGDRVMALGKHSYAELAVVKATDLCIVPDNLDLTRAGALPLVTTTGEQLIRRAAKLEPGQTVLVAGALGAVGRTAVFVAREAGATVLAGVRKRQIEEARVLKAAEVVALDDEDSLARVGLLDVVADCVGGKTAESLIGKVKQGGVFASVLGPPANAKLHPTVRVESLQAQPDPKALRALAEHVAAGDFDIPVDRMLPLSEAADAHAAAEKGGTGKILLLP
jgi:NADPH:quinone reductase-like Zn-dependent oxidoreductase